MEEIERAPEVWQQQVRSQKDRQTAAKVDEHFNPAHARYFIA
jgi:hypothetical protein